MNAENLMVDPLTIDKNDLLSHALEKMDKNDSRWIIVTSSGEPVGVMGYRDIGKELGSVKKMDLPASALHVATGKRELEPNRFLEPGASASLIAKNMTELEVGMLPVVEDGEVLGMVRDEELLPNVSSRKKVSEIMEDAPSLSPDDRLVHAREIMLDNDAWRLPIVESGRLVGMLTETDIAKAMKNFRDLVPGDQQNTRVRNILVEDVMSTDLTSCKSKDTVEDVAKLLLEKGVGGLPVLDDDGDMAGIVARNDVITLLK